MKCFVARSLGICLLPISVYQSSSSISSGVRRGSSRRRTVLRLGQRDVVLGLESNRVSYFRSSRWSSRQGCCCMHFWRCCDGEASLERRCLKLCCVSASVSSITQFSLHFASSCVLLVHLIVIIFFKTSAHSKAGLTFVLRGSWQSFWSWHLSCLQ